MPEIPLFNGGQTVKTGAIPQMPLDTQRRPRADFRGIVAGLGDVAQAQELMVKAGKQPTLPMDMYAGLEKGYDALAEGIVNVGQMVQKYAEKRQDVANHRDITNGKAEVEGLVSGLMKGQDASHPEGWQDAFNQATDKWRTEYSARKGISQYVKDEVLGALDAKKAGTQGVLYANSSEAAFKQSRAATENYVRVKAAAGDLEGVKTAVTEAYSKGIFNLEWSADTVARVTAQMGRKTLMDMAENEPGRALYFLNTPDAPDRPEQYRDLSPLLREKLHAQANLSFHRLRELAASEVKLGLAAGEITTMKDLTALQIVREQRDPITAQRIVEEIGPMVTQPDESTLRLPEIYQRIMEHDERGLMPGREAESQRLRADLAMLPDPVAGLLTSRVDSISQQPPGTSGSLHLGMRQIYLMHESGFLNLAPHADADEDVDVAPEGQAAPTASAGGGASLDPLRHQPGSLQMGGESLAPRSGAAAGKLASSWQAFNLMRGLDHYASTLGRPITTKEVEKWVDEMTVVEQRHAGAQAVLAAAGRTKSKTGAQWG